MTLFLSIKTSLLEPQFLEMAFNLHIATARLVTQYATSEDVTLLTTPSLPLQGEPPSQLVTIPECLAENLVTYLQFLRRFAEAKFEDGGENALLLSLGVHNFMLFSACSIHLFKSLLICLMYKKCTIIICGACITQILECCNSWHY